MTTSRAVLRKRRMNCDSGVGVVYRGGPGCSLHCPHSPGQRADASFYEPRKFLAQEPTRGNDRKWPHRTKRRKSSAEQGPVRMTTGYFLFFFRRLGLGVRRVPFERLFGGPQTASLNMR